ncbi:MAG TPA: LuxR C-terminal-related transcriptional regulator [Candidatus Limnocylindria bacterium]|nr:LuxR C-terminal-related transcriptional regulator [Candidatus Limnocylindria bacterium]
MARLPPEQHRAFISLVHRGLTLDALFEAADQALADLVPFDSSCWLSLDPATLLPTSHFTREIGTDHLMDLAANEFLEDDVNKFADLARQAPPVGILSQATDGDLARSPRYVRVLGPHGYQDGDELRAMFLDGNTSWGCVALHRHQGTFSQEDARTVAAVGPHLATGIRRAVLAADREVEGSGQPGLILFNSDGALESKSAAATRWLAAMLDGTGTRDGMPLIIVSLAEKARQAANGCADEVATARLPTKEGGWVVAHASMLDGGVDGRVAVMLQPAREPQIASLIVEAHGLTEREREVTRLVMQGRSTREIAECLYVTPYTVQDHIKAIFAKVGVQSRRELVAQLFLRYYAPRLHADT